MVYYTRSNAGIVFHFVKGKPLKRVCKVVRQVLVADRGKHSEKPAEIRKRIARLLGALPRVELFARKKEGLFDQH